MPKQFVREQAKLEIDRVSSTLGYLNKMLDRKRNMGFFPNDKYL
jgi:hypothetical protein